MILTMKTKILLAVAACLIAGLSLSGSAKTKSVNATGWVSDEACGATHTKPGGEDCVMKCLRGGAHVGHPEWKPQRMVLVTDEGQKIWVVENPDALKGYEGRHVNITGRLNAAKKTVRVAKATAVGS